MRSEIGFLFLGVILFGGDALGATIQAQSTTGLANAIRYNACTFDALLNSGDSGIEASPATTAAPRLTLFDNYVGLLDRSNCLYVNRAYESYGAVPDFAAISANIAHLHAISSREYILGMNVAEVVPLKGPSYYNPFEGRNFSFKAMCKIAPADTAASCGASFNNLEYREYVQTIVQQAIDVGFQVFVFGNVGYTDGDVTVATSQLVPILSALRSFGNARGISTAYVAQFPSPSGTFDYLDQFDIIQGAIYMNADGTIPTSFDFNNKDPSQPIPGRLWLQPTWFDTSRMVIEYDWFGNLADDTTELAALAKQNGTVDSIVTSHYSFFKNMNIGLWLPGRQPTAFAPWIYTPLNALLYAGQPQAWNYNDESILSIAPIRVDTQFPPGVYRNVNPGSLLLQGDGNFCYYGQNGWCTMRLAPGGSAEFTADGNLVQKNSSGAIVWQSGTGGRGATIETSNGTIAILDAARKVIWSAYTGATLPLQPGAELGPGVYYHSATGFLLLQGDGNLCYYDTTARCTMVQYFTAPQATFQLDGNLVQTRIDGSGLWISGTQGSGALLDVAGGRLVIRNVAGTVIWTL
jgi:hypothetical protein